MMWAGFAEIDQSDKNDVLEMPRSSHRHFLKVSGVDSRVQWMDIVFGENYIRGQYCKFQRL